MIIVNTLKRDWAERYITPQSGEKFQQVQPGFTQHDMPLSAIHLDIDYMDGYRVFTIDQGHFPDLDAWINSLLIQDIRPENPVSITALFIYPGVDCLQNWISARQIINLEGPPGSESMECRN